MRLLLDTHAFLWFIEADPQLSTLATNMIGDPDNERLLSAASVWEIAIKVHIGKLEMKVPGPLSTVLAQQMAVNLVRLLPIGYDHAVNVHAMPFAVFANGTEHKDPFDRLVTSQALVENLTLVSMDAVLDGYGVARCW